MTPCLRERIKPWLDVFQVTLTILAFLSAGWWFYRQGTTHPRLKLEHHITHRKVSPTRQFLVIDVVLSNVGNVPLDLKCGKIKVYEILPERKILVNSDDTCNEKERMLEPGELHLKFTRPSTARTAVCPRAGSGRSRA